MFKMNPIRTILSNFLQTTQHKIPTTQLGRWGNCNQELKLYHANIDNCGDVLCGNAQYIKNTQLHTVHRTKIPLSGCKLVKNGYTTDCTNDDEQYIKYFFY